MAELPSLLGVCFARTGLIKVLESTLCCCVLSFCPVCPVCAHTHGNNFTSFYTTSDAPIQSSLLWQTLARSLAHFISASVQAVHRYMYSTNIT